jgi:penicillin V acylase-like amidase (Ntn superfamily)
MTTTRTQRILCAALICSSTSMGSMREVQACTRTVYLGPAGMTVTGRTMDWAEDTQTNLWLFPRGMRRDGAIDANSIKWTSKHGSVIAAGYDLGSADGMNERGLVANGLYLTESDYGKPAGKTPTLSIRAWLQYVLDNHATVAEAVEALRAEPFVIVAPPLPNCRLATMHMAISDPSGDSAIFEYIDGKLQIHHGRSYQVMTNSPPFDEQLAINKYWQQIGGMLPGTNRPADRFVRASYFMNAVTKSADPRQAVATSFSVMRSISVPAGIQFENQPFLSNTVWRTVADQKNRVYYFERVLSPGPLWVTFDQLDFSEGTGVRKLTLTDRYDIIGDATDRFEKAEPFSFSASEQGQCPAAGATQESAKRN